MLSLVVGREESREGVEPDAVENRGFIRGRLRFGDVIAAAVAAASSSSGVS